MSKTPVHGEHENHALSHARKQDSKNSKNSQDFKDSKGEKKPNLFRRMFPKRDRAQRSRKANAILAIAGTALFCCAYLGVAQLIALAYPPQVDPVLPSKETLHEETILEKLEDPFYILLIGSDSRKGSALYTGKATEPSQVDQYSDVMTLLRVDPRTYQLTLLTIPQDTRLLGSAETLNASLTGGNPTQVVEAVEALTGLTIDYYMMTTFTAFEGLVDALGGVVVMVPVEIHGVDPLTADPITIPAGERRLSGAQAIVFARAWEEFGENPDVYRQENVRSLEVALIETALDSPDTAALVVALGNVWRYTDSNVDTAAIGQVALDFFRHKDDIVIYAGTGPWEPGSEDGATGIAADPEIWAALIAALDAGEDPSVIVEMP